MAIEMVGGVYCPLSPRDPDQRLHALVQQTKSRVIIVHHLTKVKFPNTSILMDTDLLIISVIVDDAILFHERIDSAITADSIAYIIFTSGSTGIPKPVSVTEGRGSEVHLRKCRKVQNRSKVPKSFMRPSMSRDHIEDVNER